MSRNKGGGNSEVERSGQTVWGPQAEGLEIMTGEKCLIGVKVKGKL